jgi:PKD repeat protein
MTAAGTIAAQSRTYAAGTDTVSVTVTDSAGHSSNAAKFTATVTNLPASIVATAAGAQTATAQVSGSFNLGSFTESNATGPYSVAVSWGDGTSSAPVTMTTAGAIPAQSHTYAAAGTDPVSVVVTDSAGNVSNTATFTVTVSPSPTGVTFVATAAAAQSAMANVAQSFDLGSFTETGCTAPFTATIDWGDGSADVPVMLTAAGAIPAQSHTYAADGPDTVTVTVTDSANHTSNPATFAVTVGQPTLVASQLAFAVQPLTASAGAALADVTVDVEDASGNPVATDTSAVTLAITGAPADVALGGTVTVAAVATFSGLTRSAAGTYTFTATDGALMAATSGAFTVTAPAGAMISGVVYSDPNGDGTQDTGDTPLTGVTVYLDIDGTGALTADDPSTVTDATGAFAIAGLQGGSYTVRQVVPAGFIATAPTLGAGETVDVQPDGSVPAPAFLDQAGAASVLPTSALVTTVLTKPAARVLGGTAGTLRIQVTNDGTTPLIDPLSSTVYVGAGASFTSSAVLAGSFVSKTLNVPAGRKTTLSVKFAYPASLK